MNRSPMLERIDAEERAGRLWNALADLIASAIVGFLVWGAWGAASLIVTG